MVHTTDKRTPLSAAHLHGLGRAQFNFQLIGVGADVGVTVTDA